MFYFFSRRQAVIQTSVKEYRLEIRGILSVFYNIFHEKNGFWFLSIKSDSQNRFLKQTFAAFVFYETALLISMNFFNGCFVLTTIIIAFYLLPQTTKTCVCLVRRNPSFLEFCSKYIPRHGWQAMFSLPSSFPFICLVLSKLVMDCGLDINTRVVRVCSTEKRVSRTAGEPIVQPLRHFFLLFSFFLFFPE